MAVMMMVAMRPRVHSKKIKKMRVGVNNGFFAHPLAIRARRVRPRSIPYEW